MVPLNRKNVIFYFHMYLTIRFFRVLPFSSIRSTLDLEEARASCSLEMMTVARSRINYPRSILVYAQTIETGYKQNDLSSDYNDTSVSDATDVIRFCHKFKEVSESQILIFHG